MGVDSYSASKPQWNMASPISTESPSTPAQSEIQPIPNEPWVPTTTWVSSWKAKLPLQTIMRLLQVCHRRGNLDVTKNHFFLQRTILKIDCS